MPPASLLSRIIQRGKIAIRWNTELADARVRSFNMRYLFFEMMARMRGVRDWDRKIARNRLFQKAAVRMLKSMPDPVGEEPLPTLFCYSYCARDILRHAKSRGWRTVLGQIDLGPGEDMLEKQLLANHPEWLCSTIQSPPEEYWSEWREECALADTIMVNSEWAKQAMIAEGIDADKLVVVPLAYEAAEVASQASGVDEAGIWNERRRMKDEGSLRPLRVLFLGQTVARKGIYDLVEAARLLANDPVIIDVVGPHRPLPDDLPSTIRFHGRVSLSEAARWYDHSDVFVLPTRSDGFAITQLEAMSHGLPVITTQCCGDVVRDGVNGLVVEAGNVVELASAMRRLAHDHQLLESLRSHAKETMDLFSLDVLGSDLVRIEPRSQGGGG
jgi:glycosyltransferase involved in cell wall biosynthesis